jgi:hypothetical protein
MPAADPSRLGCAERLRVRALVATFRVRAVVADLMVRWRRSRPRTMVACKNVPLTDPSRLGCAEHLRVRN